MPDKSLTWIVKPKPRAKRSKTIDEKLWEPFKDILHDLYYTCNLSIKDVGNHMLKHHKLRGTGRQLGRLFHDKWKWPKKRSLEAGDVVTNDDADSGELSLNAIALSQLVSIEDHPNPDILSSNVIVQVAESGGDLPHQVLYSVQLDQRHNDRDSDASEICSLETSSSSPSSRSFPRSAPATPDPTETLPLPFIYTRIHLKTPSRNAFRSETPELPSLEESEFEDILGIFPSPPETLSLSEKSKKSLHRKSSIFGCLLTFSPTKSPLYAVADPTPRLDDTYDHATTFRPLREDTNREPLLTIESDNGDAAVNPSELEVSEKARAWLSTRSTSQTIGNWVTAPNNQIQDRALFLHQHSAGPVHTEICCWSQCAETILVQCAADTTLQIEPESIGSDQRCLVQVRPTSSMLKRNTILNTIHTAGSRINSSAVESDDIKKMIRFADYLSAAGLHDDSFIWSHIIWNILKEHHDFVLTADPIYCTEVPAWISIYINMSRLCATTEHLQILAAAIEEVQYLQSFPQDRTHPSMSILYAYLGEAVQRCSGLSEGTNAAIGCWTQIPTISLCVPNYLIRKVLTTSIAAVTGHTENITSLARQQLGDFLLSTSTDPEVGAVEHSLERCVRIILSWCREELKHSAFTSVIDDIDETFWTSSSSLSDVARFERLAVFDHLCRSLWSQEHLDDQSLWIDCVEVVNALQTITTSTGLTYEAALGAALGISQPVVHPSTNPERSTMVVRFCQSIETLYNNTVMKASGFGNVGRTMNIKDLMDRYSWAGNSKPTLEAFDDPEYAIRVGKFVRDGASRSLQFCNSRALRPVLGDLREGTPFCQETLLQSTRSSQLSQMSLDQRSMFSMRRRLSTYGKTARGSGGSLRDTGCDVVYRLSEDFEAGMTLYGEQDKHVSKSSSQMAWSGIEEEKENDL